MTQFLQDPIVAIIWFGLASLVLTPAAAVAAMLFGWAWSPFAALICGLRARSLGLPPRRYTAIGALYSALFFLPWAYLTLRMFGKTVGGGAVAAGYALLYAIWFFGPVAFSFLIFAIDVGFIFSSDPTDPDPTALQIAAFLLIAALLFGNLGAMALSAWYLDRNHKRLDAAERERADFLPHRLYIMPFAHTLAATAVTAIAYLLARVANPTW